MSYLERKKQAQQGAAEPAAAESAKAQGVAASFRPKAKAKAKAVVAVKAKPKKVEPERSKIVQNVPQTRKLLATAAFELEELMANR